MCVCEWVLLLAFLFSIFCFSWHRKMQFSWHFCPKTCCQCVCVCVSVFACRLFELQYARGQQVILCGQVTCFTSLSPLHPLLSSVYPTLPLSCLLHLFPLLYLFGIFFALVSACLFLASVFLLLLHIAVFSFIWCRYLFTLSLLPSPVSLLPASCCPCCRRK